MADGEKPMPQEYGRLKLLQPITLSNGSESEEIVIFRPTCRAMTEVLDTVRLNVQIERFVEACCRAVNGAADPLPFAGAELNSIDGSELASVITAMSQDADAIVVEENGDGITQPIIYTLQSPVRLNPVDGETVAQFEFIARKVSEITEYLDARG